ncbi:MAG: DUF3179 domain-containing protein [Desulfovibrio sp.]|nr:DUF3179 domain-containing protein [Desulfovibrio sp.]
MRRPPLLPAGLFAGAAALLLLLFGGAPVQARPQNLEQLADITRYLVDVPMPGAITSLYRPRYDTVAEADLKMTHNEPAFVVIFPDGPRIYPQRYLVWHQVVNELINDHAYAVTYCPITGTFMAYDASMQGLNLIFDVESHSGTGGTAGFLYDGNSILTDRNSGSLWLQEMGMAFEGPLLGRGMPTLPVFWTTWGAASHVYPDAPVLAKPRGRRPYGRDPYGSYLKKDTYYDNDTLAYQPRWLDRRFHRKTAMLCLEYDHFLLAVDIAYVKKKGAVNFFLGPAPLLAVHDKRLDVVRIYSRQVWAEPFLFVMQDGSLTDINTKSTWDPATGKATGGNMRGASMKEFFGVYSMWFAWYSLNPETLVIPGPGEVPAHLLSTEAPGVGDTPEIPKGGEGDGALPGGPRWEPAL